MILRYISKSFSKKKLVCTTRVDSDDMLSKRFLKFLKKDVGSFLLKEKDPFIINYDLGYFLNLRQGGSLKRD